MEDIFERIDQEFLDLFPVSAHEGSTATIVTFRGVERCSLNENGECNDEQNGQRPLDKEKDLALQVCVAHVGDCCVAKLMMENTEPPSYWLDVLTEEHNSSNKAEVKRIGDNMFEIGSDGSCRLNGNLLVTRAFGNWEDGKKPDGLSVTPQTACFLVTEEEMVEVETKKEGCVGVILYSDGLIEALRAKNGGSGAHTALASIVGLRLAARDRGGRRREITGAARDCLMTVDTDEFEDDASLVIVPFTHPVSGEALVPMGVARRPLFTKG
eukprot:Platyproteum_vivax@DN3939_c0_g1_i1.p1